jgi:hypothetical protein
MRSVIGKKGVSEKAEKMDMLRGVKLEVKECHMTLETMARDPFHPERRPGLKIDVENMVVQSANAKWEVRSSHIASHTRDIRDTFVHHLVQHS